jgi:hypothetical protein
VHINNMFPFFFYIATREKYAQTKPKRNGWVTRVGQPHCECMRERDSLPYPFFKMKNLLLFSLPGCVCRALLLSPEHLPVDIHSIQPPPPPIVCECLIPFYFFIF